MIRFCYRTLHTFFNGDAYDPVIVDLIHPVVVKFGKAVVPATQTSIGALARWEIAHPESRWELIATPRELSLWALMNW